MSGVINAYQKQFYRRKFISDWKENDNMYTVNVGEDFMSRAALNIWLINNGQYKKDWITKYRANHKYTEVEFYNQQTAFLFKMTFINEKTYKSFE